MSAIERRLARWTAGLVLAAAGSGLAAAPAWAHPTDEIVQQAYLTPDGSRLDIQLVLTPGVLVAPAFIEALDTDGDGKLGADETAAHARRVTSALGLKSEGRVVKLELTRSTYADYALLASAGGAVTLDLTAALPSGSRSITFTNTYDPPGGFGTTVQANVLVPAGKPAGPADVERADEGRTITVDLSSTPGGTTTSTGSAQQDTSSGGAMLSALRTPLSSPWALLALIATCALLGAFHALTPGHGKALLASYLVGTHSTARQAVILGGVITVTHTASVIALGTAVLVAGQFIVPGVLVPVLEVASGVVVLVLGVRLLRGRWPRADEVEHAHDHAHRHAPARAHEHAPAHANTRGGHGHGHGGHRHHDHPPVMPTTFRSIATMGVSGGIVPCPEALTVLLLAIGLGRTALGLAMIVAFSAGLAGVLVGLGLILVHARAGLERFRCPGPPSSVMRWLPAISAGVVTVLGLTIAVNGVGGLTG
ncbi:nickel/cobalt transporter [Streptomyces sp. NPDC060002]|uniref:nickel/cobalt transporter n=1 Tax=Streptomyces sp. NPDC060002 TaxID=3347033 RepID=UPI0036C52A73